MTADDLKIRIPESEFIYSTSRSGGPGGQNVNKVNTKVELRFNLSLTFLLSDSEKALLFVKLKNRISNDGELILVSQSERTQLLNKEIVTEKFYKIVSSALTLQKKRRATKPTFSSKIKRLESKKKQRNSEEVKKRCGKRQ